MRHGSLFSGIGGFDLAAQWMGWENVFHCEWNEFGQKILNYYWPNAISHSDITKIDFTPYANAIDILTGGFPCQPYSLAGKRKGKDDERHLWPEMLRAIREVRPRWVVGENVFGLVNWSGGLVFNEVQTDLEAEGYEVFPYVLPACSKNAPHRRDRVWFVAYCISNGQQRPTEFKKDNYRGIQERMDERYEPYTLHDIRTSANSNTQGLQKRIQPGIGEDEHQAITSKRRESARTLTEEYWAEFPTQSPVCPGNDGLSARLDTGTISKVKWRTESIKAAGNAVVPQVAHELFKTIEQYEQL
jgi:DNA (cytosine-5)-methyltransferase 1